jgi:pimeloyl-ACP methyl ester carboxylesterase
MPESKEIIIHGNRLYYQESGSGQPLVLIHGWTGSSFDWRLVLPTLAQRFRVIVPDQIGFGKSDKPRIDYTIENFVEYLDELIENLKLEKVNLAGNSLGGHIACEYALSYPAKVKTLILIDAAGVRTKLPPFFKLVRIPGLLEWGMARISPGRYKRFMKTRGPYYNRDIITDDLVKGHMNSFLTKQGIKAAAKSFRRNIGTVYVEDRLEELNIPVLIIWGNKDITLPISMGYTFHRKIKDSKIIIIENCGHVPMEEKPDQCAKEIIDFIEK